MRIASRAELPALTRLWQTCFGDSQEVVEEFWDALFDSVTVFASEDCAAMAVGMPVRWLESDAVYFYAVCTDPARRGRGLSRTLMREAEDYLRQRGCAYAVLVPAEESLFRFYGAMGYETCFFCEKRTFSALPGAKPAQEISAERFSAIYQALDGGVLNPPRQLRYAAKFLLALPSGGCAAVLETDGGWFAPAFLSPSPDADAAAVCAFLRAPALTARMPGKTPFGMAKALNGGVPAPSFLGFDFA